MCRGRRLEEQEEDLVAAVVAEVVRAGRLKSMQGLDVASVLAMRVIRKAILNLPVGIVHVFRAA